jgi:tetratricopeptide (TPR) repeat protein
MKTFPLIVFISLFLFCFVALTSHVDAIKKPKNNNLENKQKQEEDDDKKPLFERDEDPIIQKVRKLRNIALQSNDGKDFSKSIENLREAITHMHGRVFGEEKNKILDKKDQAQDASLYAQLLNDYGNVLTRVKEFNEAILVLEDAVAMNKQLYGATHPSYGLSVRNLAETYMQNKNFKQAVKKFKILRYHIERGLGKQHEAYVEVCLKISKAYEQLKLPKKAVQSLLKVIEAHGGMDELDDEGQGIGELFLQLTTLQTSLGQLKEALDAGYRAKRIFAVRDGKNSINYAFSLNAIAGVQVAQDQVKEAHENLQKAHKIAERLYGSNDPLVKESRRTLKSIESRIESSNPSRSSSTRENKDEL